MSWRLTQREVLEGASSPKLKQNKCPHYDKIICLPLKKKNRTNLCIGFVFQASDTKRKDGVGGFKIMPTRGGMGAS